MKTILLHTAYFPPVSYFSKIRSAPDVLIEQYDHYGKQSYRNRCDILSANGKMTLSVPVERGDSQKLLTRDVLITYATAWQKLHYKGIESAYRKSPFYDYYIDEIAPCLERREKYLIDLNERILTTLLKILEIRRPVSRTTGYEHEPALAEDYRDVIHPKPARRKGVDPFVAVPYYQTFSDRFPFTPDLSILDLLFNTGPEAVQYL